MWMKPKITFSAQKDVLHAAPHPRAAVKFMPKWIREIDRNLPERQLSIKACLPVIEAVANGYVIPLWADLRITLSEHNGGVHLYAEFPSIISRPDDYDGMVASHTWEQVGDSSPFVDMSLHQVPMKLTNPWDIKTPKGYSVLIKSPPYGDHHLHVLEGIVDTDTFNIGINLPFVWTGRELGEWVIPKGTPIAQVIPFKRTQTTLEVCATDEVARERQVLNLRSVFKDGYRSMFWHKRRK